MSESDSTSTSGTGGSAGQANSPAGGASNTGTASMGGINTTGSDTTQGGSAGSDTGSDAGVDGEQTGGSTTGSGGTGGGGTGGGGTGGGGTGGGGTGGAGGTGGVGGTGGCASLLVDGGFEATPSEWTALSSGERELIAHTSSDELFITPQAGDYVAWLGFGENEASHLEQEFSVPVDADVLTASGYLWIATEENDIDGPFDYAGIELAQGENIRVQSAAWSNDDKTAGWTAFEVELEVTPYRGMFMTFRLWAASDSNLDTSFWFDTLALHACAP